MSKECNSCLYHNTKLCKTCNGLCPFTEYNFEKVLSSKWFIWVVTENFREDGTSEEMYISSASIDLPSHFLKEQGKKFNLYNKDELKYSGYIIGSYTGYEPLHDFGYRHDCDVIKYSEEEELA